MASALAPLEDHLTCSVCLEIYTDPHALKCLHTYCYQCIQQLRDNGRVQCPDCRKYTNVKDIQKNFTTQSLIDLHHESAKEKPATSRTICDVCVKLDKTIKSYCMDCNEFLCNDCHMAHQGSKSSKDHQLKPITEHCRPMQQEIKTEIEKFEVEKEQAGWKQKKLVQIIQNIRDTQTKQMAEIKDNKNAIINKAELYHNQLLHKLTCISESLVETLEEHEMMFDQGKHQLEERIKALSKVSQSQDYALLIETLENLSEATEQELGNLRKDLPVLDPQVKSPVVVERGKDWQPEECIRIRLENHAMPQTQKICYQRVKSVDMDCWPRKLLVHQDELWVAGGHKGVFVYNTECEQLRHIQSKQFNVVTGLAKSSVGDCHIAVCDRTTGLHRLNQKGDYVTMICEGNFSDVSSYKHTLYALDYKKCCVLVFHNTQGCNTWVIEKEFQLQHNIGHMSDKLCITKAGLYVSSFYHHSVYVYSLNGDYCFKTGEFGEVEPGRFRNPYLCDCTSPSRVLVCDWRNHRLQALDTVDVTWHEVDLGAGVRYPVSVGVGPKILWLGTVPSLFGPRSLLKYERIDETEQKA